MLDFAKNKDLWKRVREDDCFARHRKEIKESYDKLFEAMPACMTAREILENDTHQKYFKNICALQTAALMALIYPDNEEYFENLKQIVWVYCNEYTWAPLGHYNEYYDRTPADYDPGLIDIFAASIAFSMAEIKNLFKDRFPKLLVDRMTAEIRRRTIEPYLTRKFFWEKHDNNWTAVCTGAVGGVLMYEAPELFLENQERIHASMECYLKSYNDDGMCVEGVAYWGFGFGFFASYALLEREFTGGKVDWFKRDKVRAISKYLQKMFLDRDVIATYGDCNIKEGYWIGLPHLLKSIYGDEIECLPDTRGTIVAYCHLCFSLRSVIYYNPDYVSQDVDKSKVYCDEGSSYFTKRTPFYGFTARGGDNGESHNHNDVGSFILTHKNEQVLLDFGYIGSVYPHPDYHGHLRYTYFQPSSYSHNVPILDGIGQDGVRRERVIPKYNEADSSLYIDFTGGYGVEKLKKAERQFFLENDKITLKDTFELTDKTEVVERFVTTIKPVQSGSSVILGDVEIQPLTPASLKITPKEYESMVEKNGSFLDTCYLIDYTLDNTNEFILDMRVKAI